MIKKILSIIVYTLHIPLSCVNITFQQNTSKPQPEHIIEVRSTKKDTSTVHSSMSGDGTYSSTSTSKRYFLNPTTPSLTLDLKPEDVVTISAYQSQHPHIGHFTLRQLCKKFSINEDMHNHTFTLDEFSLAKLPS